MQIIQEPTHDEKVMAMLCHLGGLAGFIPLGNILVPLIIWAVKKDQSTYIDMHGKEAINFQISITIYSVVAAILIVALVGFLILPVIAIFDLIFIILASIKAYEGNEFHYPLAIPLIK